MVGPKILCVQPDAPKTSKTEQLLREKMRGVELRSMRDGNDWKSADGKLQRITRDNRSVSFSNVARAFNSLVHQLLVESK